MGEQARDRWLERFAVLMARLAPDAISAGVILTVVIIAVSLILGNPLTQVMDAYHQGLWMLLPFTMQMTLIIVLSSVLAATPFFRMILVPSPKRKSCCAIDAMPSRSRMNAGTTE